ncbi:hypothetical protein SAMN04489727_9545 [Amycolatopsis tolypomycina]|uniref:Uncharacterized protein n=1 Tax=Amycolatopsis tolypomycina TaxID=208445 RepID=A0A1H5DRS5_9PSEU|nr:hypothetical protein SAMN04489727_9545 [Amycolatopsis tolypomycina]
MPRPGHRDADPRAHRRQPVRPRRKLGAPNHPRRAGSELRGVGRRAHRPRRAESGPRREPRDGGRPDHRLRRAGSGRQRWGLRGVGRRPRPAEARPLRRRCAGAPGCPAWRAEVPLPRSKRPGVGPRGFPPLGGRRRAGVPRPRPTSPPDGLRDRHRWGAAARPLRGRPLGGVRGRRARVAVPPPRRKSLVGGVRGCRVWRPLGGVRGRRARQPLGGGPGCPGSAPAPRGVRGEAGHLRPEAPPPTGGGGVAAAGGSPTSAAGPGWPPGGVAGGGLPAGAPPRWCGGAGGGGGCAVDVWRPWVLGPVQAPGPTSERAAGKTAARLREDGVPAGRVAPRGPAGGERRWSWRRRRRR